LCIRDDSGIKVKLLGGNNIGHREKKKSLHEYFVSNFGPE